jgi:GDP-4-dehydro-6-deoxy-D-mannose reductase
MGPTLVTGGNGFAGGHLLDALAASDAPVVAWHGPESPVPADGRVRWLTVDLRDRGAVKAALGSSRPARVFHCAGIARVAESWREATATLELNALGTHHLLDAARDLGLDARIVIPGSGLVYRASTEAHSEDDPVEPATPYGLSKLAQELVALAAAEDGLAVVVARAFNHIGPRQSPGFVTASFARQIALAEAGLADPVIQVGNLDARRDVTDVRDVVRAYLALAENGRAGRIYNVCSGTAPPMCDLLDGLIALARVHVEVRTDDARLRPSDTPVVLGSPARIRQEVGWAPAIPLDRSLEDLLEYWRVRVAREARTTGTH